MCEKKITNEDVLNFYVEKGVKYDNEEVEKLIKEYFPSPKGAYEQLANTFIKKGTKGTTENKEFYEWLEGQKTKIFLKRIHWLKLRKTMNCSRILY